MSSVRDPREEAAPAVERKLVAIMSGDIAGYSRLMGDDDVATVQTLTVYRVAITVTIERHRGRLVDFTGDNLLATFASTVDAVECASALQADLTKRNAEMTDSRRMEFRFGVNLGEVIVDGERIYGDGVNVAARLQGLAQPGGVYISAAVHEQVEKKLALAFDCVGEHTVKNIEKPVVVYCVRIATLDEADTVTSADTPGPAREASMPSLPPPRSIAVLPFEDLTADPASGPFVSGLTEDLVTDLAKLPDVTVVAVPQQAGGSSADAIASQKARQQLGARYLLEGSVRQVEDTVRITAQLVEVATGHHVWGERYDRPLGDIFAVQDDVVESVIVGVQAALALGDAEAAR